MIIGICSVELYLPGITSLKEKRNIINSIKASIRNHFNVAISEIDYLDKWQRCILGIVGVSNDGKFMESLLKKILNNIQQKRGVEILDYNLEVNNGVQARKGEFPHNKNNI